MIVLALLGGFGSGFVTAVSCQMPPQASYEVTLTAEPVTVASSFGLADIEDLARGGSGKAGHPPVGFYVGTFAYSIDVIQDTLPGLCPGRVAVHVFMSISRRHIEVGRELASRRCLYSVFVDHYRKHADNDVALIEGYRERVEHALRDKPPRLRGGEHPAARVERAEITRITAESVETTLQGLSDERATAAQRVDTPDEVRRLTDACADRA